MVFPAKELSLWHLEQELLAFGVDPRCWKSSKTPADLLEELRAGESQLVLARLVEEVKMQILSIRRDGQELLELGKKHAGMEPVMRKKPRAPSGKKGTNETPYVALERELWEELHLRPEEVELIEGEAEMDRPEDSPSFAGILDIHKLYWNELWLTEQAEAKLQAFWSEERQRYEIPDQSEEGKKRGTMLFFAWAPLPAGH